MFDNQPLDDFELTRLERHLSNVDLSPPRHQRERLLYACGRAAGLAEMRRRVRAATATAVVVVAASAVLCLVLVTTRGATTTDIVQNASVSPKHSVGSPPRLVQRERFDSSDKRDEQLTVSAGFAQSTVWEAERRDTQHHAIQPTADPRPMLTVASALISNSFAE
jgi:hypothetical protein